MQIVPSRPNEQNQEVDHGCCALLRLCSLPSAHRARSASPSGRSPHHSPQYAERGRTQLLVGAAAAHDSVQVMVKLRKVVSANLAVGSQPDAAASRQGCSPRSPPATHSGCSFPLAPALDSISPRRSLVRLDAEELWPPLICWPRTLHKKPSVRSAGSSASSSHSPCVDTTIKIRCPSFSRPPLTSTHKR